MKIDVKFIEKFAQINVDFGEFKVIHTGDAEIYTGSYVAKPKAYVEQILNTANKLLVDNITIKEIPCFEQRNEYGNTMVIGE